MKRLSFMRRAAPWWIIGLCLHGCWFFGLLFGLSDTSLEETVTEWVRRNRTPNQAGPDYMIAIGYIVGVLFWTFVAAMLAWVVAGFLSWRQGRAEYRISRGLCPKCAYDLRGTRGGAATACPECGAAVNRIAR